MMRKVYHIWNKNVNMNVVSTDDLMHFNSIEKMETYIDNYFTFDQEEVDPLENLIVTRGTDSSVVVDSHKAGIASYIKLYVAYGTSHDNNQGTITYPYTQLEGVTVGIS